MTTFDAVTLRARAVAPALPDPAIGVRSPGARAMTYGLLSILWVACLAVPIAQTLTMSRRVAVEGVQTAITKEVSDAWSVAFYLPAVLAVLILAFGFVTTRNDLAPLVVLVLPWIWIVVDQYLRGAKVPVEILLPIGIAVAFWVVQPRVADLKIYALLGAALAAVTMALTSVAPTLMYMPQSFDSASDKTLTGLPLLAGAFSHPNLNGLFLILALPLTHLFERWYLRWTTAAVLIAGIVWSSSRTAFFGIAVWLVVILLSLVLRSSRRRVLGILLLVLLAAVVIVPLATKDPAAFTERGAIWLFNLGQLHGSQWIWGLGHSWYLDNYWMLKDALSSSAGHGHNIFVTYVVTGGVVLFALIALVLLRAGRSAADLPRREQVGAYAFLCVLAFVSISETAWRVEAPDPLFASMVVPLFVIATQSRRVSAAAPRASGDMTGEPLTRRVRSGRR